MSTPTVALTQLLDIAHDGGSVDQAICTAGKNTLIEAGDRGLIQIDHDVFGVVGARWAANQAGYVEQRNNMHLQLTDAGRNHRETS